LIKDVSKARIALLALFGSFSVCNTACLGYGAGAAIRLAGEYAKNYADKKKAQQDADAVLLANAQVELEHACNGGELLLSRLRDYQKRPWCAKCDSGQTFISDGKGGGLETCSACGSGDVVAKLGPPDRKPFCDLIQQVKSAESDSGLSDSDELSLAMMQAKVKYGCRAGEQEACNAANSFQNAAPLDQLKEQTATIRSQAAALWSQASALQTANQQRWEASQSLSAPP
jgi:hypothetical protein